MSNPDEQMLSKDEQQLLTREVATDKAYYNSDYRDAFKAGWDAAMEYVAKKLAEGVEHLDET